MEQSRKTTATFALSVGQHKVELVHGTERRELTVEILRRPGKIFCVPGTLKFVLRRQSVNDGRHNPGGNNGW